MRSFEVALTVLLIGCVPPIEEECPAATPEKPVTVPPGCWQDDDCSTRNEVEDACGAAYWCPTMQGDVCVVAAECACQEEAVACGYDVEIPPHCGM